MFKKKLLSFLMIGIFGLATLFSVDAQTTQTADGVNVAIGDADVLPVEPVKCYCFATRTGKKCRAGNAGTLCASGSADNPSVKCWDYDKNCL